MRVSELFEAREPGLKYTTKMVKGKLDKVIVELEGNQSGAMSRLTSRYKRLDIAAKLMQERRNELNTQMKYVGESLFDAEDTIATRIIETISFTVMLTKAEKAENKSPTKRVDYASLADALAKLIPDELQAKVEELTKLYTETIDAKDTPTALRVTPKVPLKPLKEGALDSVLKFVKKFVSSITSWASGYDKKLNALKKQAGML